MNHHNALFKLGIATWLSKSMQESQFYNKMSSIPFLMMELISEGL